MAKLQKGVNDLKTWCSNNGDFGKQLIQEWTGECEDGSHYKIDELSFGSNKKFKWRCSNGHEWFAAIVSRTNGRGCPYCAGILVSDKNSLKTWCSSNGEFGKQLMQEWTGECEDGSHYKIDETSFGSNKKVKWRCSKGHEWFSTIHNRTLCKRGCPYCSGNLVSDKNSLKTWCFNNGKFGKQLMQEWTGECEDGSHYKIDELSFGSNKQVKWRCNKGHEWFSAIATRTRHKCGCPYCSGRLVSDKNNLSTWCLNNGEWGQQIIQEWTGECEDGSHYKIDELSFGSNKKVKWRCSKGHEWFNCVCFRTRGYGCPHCNHNSTSYPEQFIYWSLKQLYPNTENRCRVLKSPENPQGIEFDIGIPEIPLCIEYSPTRWHNESQERDNYKKELCKKANIRLIQIIVDSYDELEHCIKDDYICFKMIYSEQDEILVYIVDHILKSLGHSISEIDLELVKKNAWEYSRGKIEYEKSLASIHPKLAEEWHPTLNAISSDEVKSGSNTKIYWQCTKCKHGKDGEWQAPPNRRTAKGYETGCPKCGYNWYKAQQGLPQRYRGLYSYLNDQGNT